MHKVGGIHLQVIDIKPVDIYLTIKKRHQLHVHHSPFQVGYSILALRQRIIRLNNLHAVHAEIEREDKANALHADLHSHLLRSIGSNGLYRPVLNRWKIECNGKKHDQDEGSEHYTDCPLHIFIIHRIISVLPTKIQ